MGGPHPKTLAACPGRVLELEKLKAGKLPSRQSRGNESEPSLEAQTLPTLRLGQHQSFPS